MRVLVCVRVCLSVISHIVKPMQWPHSGGLSCVFACIFCLCEVTSNRNMILYFHIPLCFRMYLNLRFVVSMNRDPLKKRLRLQKPHLCSDMRVTNKLLYIYIFFNYLVLSQNFLVLLFTVLQVLKKHSFLSLPYLKNHL